MGRAQPRKRDETRAGETRGRRVGLVALAVMVAAVGLWLLRPGRDGQGASATSVAANGSGPAPDGVVTVRRATGLLDADMLGLGAISGTVRDEAGAPVVGARVCARGVNDELSAMRLRFPTCSQTQRDGRYVIEGLLPASYGVGASARGYLPTGRFAGADPKVDAPDLLLAAGARREGVDFSLVAGGVRVAGRVLDVAGGPVEHAWVMAQGIGNWTPTDAEGRFEMWTSAGGQLLGALAPGYALGMQMAHPPTDQVEILLAPEATVQGRVIVAETGAPVAGVGIYRPDLVGWPPLAISDAGGRFSIDGREPGRLELEARSDEYYGRTAGAVALGLGELRDDVVIEVHPAVEVEGSVVVGDSETPCPSGKVELISEAGDRYADWFGEDAAGRFSVAGLRPGTYRPVVACDGHLARDDYPEVFVEGEPPEPLRFEVEAGLAIAGRVVDGEGAPVVGATVTALERDTAGKAVEPVEATSRQDGAFVLRGLPPAKHDVLVTQAASASTPSDTRTVDLSNGVDVSGVDIEVESGAVLEGRVTDTTGAPVIGARVEPVAARAMDFAWGPRKQAQTDAEGRYRVDGLDVGPHRVQVGRSRSETYRHPGQGAEDPDGVSVSLVAGETRRLDIQVVATDGVITGSVASEGGPVADAFVHYAKIADRAGASEASSRFDTRWSQLGARPIVTDQDGDFRIEGLQHGRYTIRVDRRGGGEAFADAVETGSHVDIEIAATGSIEGAVVVPGGELPDTLKVTLHEPATARDLTQTVYRSGGTFAFERVPAGRYQVVVNSSLGKATRKVELAAGEQRAGVTVELAPVHDVRGRLVDLESGAPLAGLVVYATARGDPNLGYEEHPGPDRITGGDGRFELHEVPTGAVVLVVLPRDFTGGLPEYGMLSLVRKVARRPALQDLGDITLARRRVFGDMVPGALGFTNREYEAGEDGEDRPIEVASVREGGPAARAGMVVGDQIVSVDGHDVSDGDPNGWYSSLIYVPPGTTVALGVARGAVLNVTAEKAP